MSKLTKLGIAVLLVAAQMPWATAQSKPPTVSPVAAAARPFDVFVDPASRFVFIKLPAGWKFVGALSDAEMLTLPDHVLTSLLPGDPERQARE